MGPYDQRLSQTAALHIAFWQCDLWYRCACSFGRRRLLPPSCWRVGCSPIAKRCWSRRGRRSPISDLAAGHAGYVLLGRGRTWSRAPNRVTWRLRRTAFGTACFTPAKRKGTPSAHECTSDKAELQHCNASALVGIDDEIAPINTRTGSSGGMAMVAQQYSGCDRHVGSTRHVGIFGDAAAVRLPA